MPKKQPALESRPYQHPMAEGDFWAQVAAKKPGTIPDDIRAFAQSKLKKGKGKR